MTVGRINQKGNDFRNQNLMVSTVELFFIHSPYGANLINLNQTEENLSISVGEGKNEFLRSYIYLILTAADLIVKVYVHNDDGLKINCLSCKLLQQELTL